MSDRNVIQQRKHIAALAADMTEAEAADHWRRWEGFRAATGRTHLAPPGFWTQPTFVAAGLKLGKLSMV